MVKKTAARSPWRARLMALGALAALVGLVLLIRAFSATGKAYVEVNALPNQHIEVFGNDIVYYDGAMIHRIGSNGVRRWSFQAGQLADFHVSSKRIVAWSANQFFILDPASGNAVYNDRMDAAVQFARAGQNYVAVFVGEKKDTGTVYVLDATGKRIDAVTIDGTMPLDIGFFTGGGELMWLLMLDTFGSVPTTTLQTFDLDALLSTGSATLGEELVYRVYYHNGALRVADTRQITTYDYRIKEDTNTPQVLIYGWYLKDVRVINRELYQLLVPMPRNDGGLDFSDVRLIYGGVNRVLHLPTASVGVLMGSKAVYAFAGGYVYTCHYGDNSFMPAILPMAVSKVLGITQDDHAVVADNNKVYLVKLPQ